MNFIIKALRSAAAGKKPTRFDKERIVTILLVEMTRMGDVIAALPSIRSLKSQFPESKIHFFTRPAYTSLLDAMDIDITVHGMSTSNPIGFAVQVINATGHIRPDMAISLSPGKANAFIVLASGASAMVGYLEGGSSLTPFRREHPIEMFGLPGNRTAYENENIYLRSWKILESLGWNVGKQMSGSKIRTERTTSIAAGLNQTGILPRRPFIVIHPFAGWEYRCWPAHKFMELSTLLLIRTDHDILFLCAAEEKEKLGKIINNFSANERVHSFASNDLVATAVIISKSDAFVGNDSGPLHLAAALGVKHVGIFGPADPRITAPPTSLGIHLYKKVHCSPCDQLRCVQPDNHCMELISSEEVGGSIREMLAKESIVDV